MHLRGCLKRWRIVLVLLTGFVIWNNLRLFSYIVYVRLLQLLCELNLFAGSR